MGHGTGKSSVEQLLTEYDAKDKTVLEIVSDAEDKGIKTLTVNVERKAPVRSETYPRAHVFKDIAGFSDYLVRNGATDDVMVFCNPDTGCFAAVLNEAEAQGTEIVYFQPQPHPTYVEWANVLERPLDFPALSAFIQRQRRVIDDGAGLAGMLRQIKASTKVELLNGVGKDAVNGLTYTVKIQGIDKGKDAELPDVIVVTLPLYMDSPTPTRLEIDLTLEAKDEGKRVLAVLSAPTLKVAQFAALQEYAALLKGFNFAFGAPEYSRWQYQS